MSALFIILVSLRMTIFSEKVLISTRYISGLVPNLIKKSWTDSSQELLLWICWSKFRLDDIDLPAADLENRNKLAYQNFFFLETHNTERKFSVKFPFLLSAWLSGCCFFKTSNTMAYINKARQGSFFGFKNSFVKGL